MKIPRPLRSFRVYPEKKSLYWEVQLYPDVQSMRLAYLNYRGKILPKISDGTAKKFVRAERALAVTAGTTFVRYTNGRARTFPVMGRIFFAFGKCGGMIVSHECAHATRYYFNRMKIKMDDPKTDERFAQVLGDMVYAIGKEIW